jgi:hypothetical protein
MTSPLEKRHIKVKRPARAEAASGSPATRLKKRKIVHGQSAGSERPTTDAIARRTAGRPWSKPAS